jgi:hypothetical protein
MEIRFSQARYEINPGLFKRIDNLRRDFAFHVSSWQVKHRSLPFNTEASGFIQEAEGAIAIDTELAGENEARLVAIYLSRHLGRHKHGEIGAAVELANTSSASSAYLRMKSRVVKKRR